MPNITSVTLTSGLGTGGTGTISTLDNLIGTAGSSSAQVLSVQGIASGTAAPTSVADGSSVALGAKADAAWSSGSGSAIAILKTIANDVGSAIPAGTNVIGSVKVKGAGTYNTVAASQTAQALTGGSGGATGDYLEGLLVIPAAAAAGTVSIKDGAGSAISLFAGGGVTALLTLIPFFVPIDAVSTGGAWSVTTGANVSVVATGTFT